LTEYELPVAIKESNAEVIMGASAGMMNMGMHWVSDHYVEKHSSGKIKAGTICDGLGLDHFAARVHYSPNDVEADPLEDELLALSHRIDVYAACNGSVIRSKDGKLRFWGDVYLVSNSKIKKIEETDFSIE
jgi:cyanophycinase